MNVIRLFDEVARSRPADIAVCSMRGAYTYDALARRATAIARGLRARGVGPGALVGVSVARSLESIAAVVGVLRAGAAYVPIDPAYPEDRQQFMARDAGIAALVVAGTAAPAWARDVPIVDVGALAVDIERDEPLELPDTAPDDLLYVLYTSGSTGRPKGVCGTHAATLHRLRWGWETFPFAPDEVVAHRSSLNFVDAGPEIFSGLLRGVRTAVIAPEEVADLRRFVEALQRLGVTRLTTVPSILASLVRAMPDLGAALPRVRHWISSGEALSALLLSAFRATHPAATLVNLYGTTEVTGDVTAAVFAPDTPLPAARVPIGRAIAGAELFVLDAQGRPVAAGEPGELYVAGPVLARGYHRRPNEETLRFVRYPATPATRAFRTGDRVRWNADGALEYLGREDGLVKIRGVRVELGEVERVLRAECPAAADVVAVLADDGERLVAFVTPADVEVGALRAAAARSLPAVMHPSEVIAVAAWPLLPNGKVDRRALAARASHRTRELTGDRAPRTPSERRVASLWAPLLHRSDIGRDDSFASLGGDSLGLAELVMALEHTPGGAGIELALARDGTLAQLARALDGERVDATPSEQAPVLSLTPLGDAGARDEAVIAMFVEASMDPQLIAAAELPARLTEAAARAYCRAHDGVVLRVDGVPAGAGVVQPHPNVGVGEGVTVPPGAVQLEEWLLPRWRGLGLLDKDRAWPLLVAWLAQRYEHEVSCVWEDHVAMIAILRARGYQRLGRTFWTSGPDGDGGSGACEVWTYDLRPHRRAGG